MFSILCRAAAAACLAFSLGPLVYRVFNAGSVVLLIFGLVLGGLCCFWDSFPDKNFPGYPRPPRRWWRNTRRALSALLALAAAGGAALSVPMAAHGWWNAPREGEAYTVVVLGCKVRGDQPSLMLRYRLDAALRYLEENPEAPVVVTGGYDEAEGYAEGDVAEGYLLEKGLDPSRIYKENTSRNTLENLENAAAVIREEGLPGRAALCTDGFHQWRGSEYAKRAGLREPAAIPAKTPWGLFPVYWVREMAAILKMYILDL